MLKKEFLLRDLRIQLAFTTIVFIYMEEKIWSTLNLMIFGALILLRNNGDKLILRAIQEGVATLQLLLVRKILFSEVFWRLQKN